MGKRRAFYSASYFFWLELKRMITGKKFLAEFDVTDNCNLRCRHCYHFNHNDKIEKKEVPISVWKKRFEELYKSGTRVVLMVGGEPALRADVLDLANQTFPIMSVITNGTIKIPKKFNHRLVVSIDGAQKKNDSIRGEGVFSKVIKNYSGDNRVILNITLMGDNIADLEEVVKTSKKNGFGGVICNVYDSGIGSGGSTPQKEQRKIIMNEVKRVKSLYPKDFLLNGSMVKWFESPDHSGSCYWGKEALHFDVSWKKRKCFGDFFDCSNCGCFAGSMANPIKWIRHPKEIFRII